MSEHGLQDELLVAVRSARPARPENGDSPFSAEAQTMLERVLSVNRPRSLRRVRVSIATGLGRTVPVVASLAAIAIVVVALTTLGRRPALHRSAPGGGSGHALTATQYSFAVGGDDNSRLPGGVLLFRADQVLRGRCMKRRGFHYVADLQPRTGRLSLPSVTGYPSTFYAQPSVDAYPEGALLALRERHGFGIYNGAVSAHVDPDPDDRYLKTLPAARQKLWLKAWRGPNGCSGRAEVQLYGSRRAANMELLVSNLVYNYLNSAVYDRGGAIARIDQRTYAVTAAWSRCMNKATGHDWSDENALISWLYRRYTPARIRTLSFRRQEISEAVADTECSYRTGQAQTFAAAFVRAADHLPARIQTQLSFLLVHRPSWVARARRILGAVQLSR
jgi:hypothetical protein